MPVLLMLLISGCDENRPGVINDLIFNDDTDWVDLDSRGADPTELVNDECCNDFIPLPIVIDTSLTARIEPADDLDWFKLQTTDTTGGVISLSPGAESINFRLFDGQQQEFEVLIDTLSTYLLRPLYDGPVYWTPLAGESRTYYVLVQSDDEADIGGYSLIWSQQQRNSQLTIKRASLSTIQIIGSEYVIQWDDPNNRRVSLALLRDGIMVSPLGKDLSGSMHELQYRVDADREPDSTYQIMLYQSNDPQIMDISNVFTIR